MQIELRENKVIIDGYVNAVERESNLLRDTEGQFVEIVKAGTFGRALERAKAIGQPVKVLLNHHMDKTITVSTADDCVLTEDSIGLHIHLETEEPEVIQRANDDALVGWSFGFLPLAQSMIAGNPRRRELRDINLIEVSLLDKTKRPAYDGTSVEVRQNEYYETRDYEDKEINKTVIEETNKEETKELNASYKNRILTTMI